jgi:hypothetical protein
MQSQKNWVLKDDEARGVFHICSILQDWKDFVLQLTLEEFMDHIGPLPEPQENARRLLGEIRDDFDKVLELVAKFGGEFEQRVRDVRKHRLVKDVVFMFQRLLGLHHYELRV